jgi:transcriptional regulator with XRE-family HTH domain
MTQADVAAAMRRTQGWVSKVEQGSVELDRVSVINELAACLHCHPNDLMERPYLGTATENRWQVPAASIVRELRRFDLTPVFDGRPGPSAALWQQVERLHPLRDAADNAGILAALPDLLREARALAEVAGGREREEAFAVYAVACKFGHTAAHALGHPELVAMACERAAWAAARSGDPLLPAVADWLRVWNMWGGADWDDAVSLSDRALDGIAGLYAEGQPLALRTWGSLQLRAAISTARSGNSEAAQDRIALAREAAERLDAYEGAPVHDRHSLTFGTGNVLIHGVAAAIEVSDHTQALALDAEARRTHPEALATLPKSRRGHHHMDLSRAWLWNGNRDRALAELEQAERTAPQLIRNHPIARATLRKITYAERTVTRDRLRRMANRFRLEEN